MPKLAKTGRSRITISLPDRLKRRLTAVSVDRGLSLNDLCIHAIQDFLDRSDGTYQNADLVADRLSQVLNSQIALIQQFNRIDQKLDDITNS